MIRYCGQCGTTLTAAALQAGRCPQCGAAIEYSGDTLGPDAAPPGDMPTHLMDRASAAVPATDAAATRISSADATSARQPVERGSPYIAGSQGAPQVGTLMTQPQATRRTRWEPSEWPELFPDPLLANATLDRLLHQASVLLISGRSYRLASQAAHADKPDGKEEVRTTTT
jgi:hypothetical protein